MEARALEVRQPTMQATGGKFTTQDGLMTLKEYRLIGGGKYTFADKINSAKKTPEKPQDTTFNGISESPNQSKSNP